MNLTSFEDNGSLIPIEFKDLPFNPKRAFYIKNVPINTERGNHAHFITKQFLICIQGKILVKLWDGINKKEYTLEENQTILIENLIWDSQVFLTNNAVLLCLCSTPYIADDYILDLDLFKNMTNKL